MELTLEEKFVFLSGVRKNDKIVPVLTLVLYFGQDKWDGPVSLHEMFDVQDHELLKFIPDYRINLVSPVAMTKEEIGKFRSQFQALAGVIRFEQDKKELSALFESNEVFRHLSEDTVNVINAVTGAEIGYRTDEKGDVDMCKAIKEMLADSKVEGIQLGKQEGILVGAKNQSIKNAETMIARGKYPLEEIAENSGLSLEEVREIAKKRTA